MCADQERFVWRWFPSNLNVESRSIAPDEVKRGGKLIEIREPRIIYLVLDVLICISWLAVQVSTEVNCDGMLLTEPVDGINSENVVSSTNLCTSQSSSEVVNEDYKRQGTESWPLGHTAAKCFPGGNELTDTLATVWQIRSEPFKQTVRDVILLEFTTLLDKCR